MTSSSTSTKASLVVHSSTEGELCCHNEPILVQLMRGESLYTHSRCVARESEQLLIFKSSVFYTFSEPMSVVNLFSMAVASFADFNTHGMA